jgi:hypothetical protein
MDKRARKFYSGDLNIEHGGFFYTLDNFDRGYVDAVRVTPCSDAGGPDNVFWIECLSVLIPEQMLPHPMPGLTHEQTEAHHALHGTPRELRAFEYVMNSVGYDSQEMWDQWRVLTVAQRRHILVIACVGYGQYDINESEMVQLGAVQGEHNKHEASSRRTRCCAPTHRCTTTRKVNCDDHCDHRSSRRNGTRGPVHLDRPDSVHPRAQRDGGLKPGQQVGTTECP